MRRTRGGSGWVKVTPAFKSIIERKRIGGARHVHDMSHSQGQILFSNHKHDKTSL